MDNAWFHHLTSSAPAPQEKSLHRRRASLLQQPAEGKADEAIEAIEEVSEDDEPWRGPPPATPARRAQSYSDFYHVASAHAKKELGRKELHSGGLDRLDTVRQEGELAFDEECSAAADAMINSSHHKYQTHQELLELSSSHLENLLASTQDTLQLLAALSNSFRAVESQTDAFREQCTTLITETQRLDTLADAVEENARYYTYLEPMTRRLNAPGAANLVKGNDFPEMLSNLDNCLAYMEAHPSHKESATYRSRYRLLLTRALTLIRHHFTKSLGDIAADITKRIQGGQLKETTHSALLYAKFRVPAPELKSLGLEIQKRAVPTPDDVDAGREPEYMSLLHELYQSYSTTRGRLILPLVSRKMAELGSTSQQTDVLAFARSSISFMRGICLDEYELWFELFETEGALYAFLDSLMEPMFDYLRPRMIHETALEKLCELCAMIQGRFMESESDQEDDAASMMDSPLSGENHPGRRLDFSHLIQPALADAQTRLVFLALNVLKDGIESYRPKPEDTDWPKRPIAANSNGMKKGPVLSGKRDPPIAESPIAPTPKTTIGGAEDVDDGESIFSKQLLAAETTGQAPQQWYPTLRKAIWLLRRIYRLVNSTVFDDLAHRIVHSTISSLLYASQLVTTKKSLQDGQLFLITHLLHLKQQIVAFDIEFIPPEVEFDFSSVTNPFYELRDRGSLWNPASWVRLVGGAVGGGLLPKVVENMLDAKAELDGRVRTVINDFVNGYANHIIAPLDAAPAAGNADSKAKTKDPPFDAVKALRTVRGLAEKDVPAMRAKLQEFIDDARTRETLVSAVRDQVVLRYEEFFDVLSEGQSRKLSRKGKGREDEVWGPDMFEEAMERVFHVASVFGENEEKSDKADLSE